MEFQKARVFTALNADELKIGSKVIVGDTVEALRNRVQNGTTPLTLSEIRRDSYERRFRVEEYTEPESVFSFVYLISGPEIKDWIVYIHRKNPDNYYLTSCRSDAWETVQKDYNAKTKLFEGTYKECDKWYESRRHFSDVMAAWEDGKTIQYYSRNSWEDCCNNKPSWDIDVEYRIKPEGLKWTDLKIGDIIRYDNKVAMVTAIDTNPNTTSHIYTYDWMFDDDLEECEKVELNETTYPTIRPSLTHIL